jgi:phospholipid transport system substrate-binding protein
MAVERTGTYVWDARGGFRREIPRRRKTIEEERRGAVMGNMRARSWSIGTIGLLVLLLFSPAEGRAEVDAASTVRGFYDVLLSTMRDGPQLGPSGRYAKLEPVILKVFDVPYMTRMAVGASWAATPDPKQHQAAEAFGHYMTATWADRFDSYSGEKLEVTGEQPYATGAVVHTRIVKSNGEPVAIDYLMRRNGDVWQIADVYLTGTISEVATRRSEFSSVLRSQGIDGLIAVLNRKAGILVSATLPSLPGS